MKINMQRPDPLGLSLVNTQLQDAILSKDMPLVRHVLEIDPLSIHHTNEVGFTALMISCTTEQPDIARVLLDAGADVNAKGTETGFCALHCVVAHPPIVEANGVKLLEMLLARGSDVNAKSFEGETPLMFAAWFNNGGAVKLLLKKGARLDLADRSGRTARDMALMKNNKSVAALLSR